MFDKLVIANRGEIALRILRACWELGIKTVAAHSQVDRDQKHVLMADETVCIGPGPAPQSYLNIPALLSAAEVTDAEAIHPGYGFLAENATFAEQAESSGFVFVGPRPETIRVMGDKLSGIAAVKKRGICCVPGSEGALTADRPRECRRLAQEIGYTGMIKAAAGGGGRGMRVVHSEATLLNALSLKRIEAKNAFGTDTMYLEKYMAQPRHIEVQVLADRHANVVQLGERDCSMQRRNQKLLEEAPAIGLSEQERRRLGKICVEACRGIGYRGAGTLEFLYQDGRFYFIEMNTRIQVEHAVTEMVTGIDIVKEQLRIAAGEKLSLEQRDIQWRGHAIECRINAEHPDTFAPSPGVVRHYHPPGGPGVRMDTHIYQGYRVPPHYDSMIGKLIVHAETREAAFARLANALNEIVIEGIETNLPLHRRLVKDSDLASGAPNIHFLEKWLARNPLK